MAHPEKLSRWLDAGTLQNAAEVAEELFVNFDVDINLECLQHHLRATVPKYVERGLILPRTNPEELLRRRPDSQTRYRASEKGKASEQKYRQSEKGKAKELDYNQSAEGKASQARYEASEKGKASEQKYRQSEKGKATQLRQNKTRREARRGLR